MHVHACKPIDCGLSCQDYISPPVTGQLGCLYIKLHQHICIYLFYFISISHMTMRNLDVYYIKIKWGGRLIQARAGKPEKLQSNFIWPNIYRYIYIYIYNPWHFTGVVTLQEWCRVVITRAVRRKKKIQKKKIQQLPLPESLKHYLLSTIQQVKIETDEDWYTDDRTECVTLLLDVRVNLTRTYNRYGYSS